MGRTSGHRAGRAARRRSPHTLILGALVLLGLVATPAATASAAGCSSADDFSAAAAVPIFPSCFEGADGDMLADGPSPKAIDWQSIVGQAGTDVTQDATGATDDTLVGGSKEEQPGGWGLVESPSSPRDDIFSTAARVDPLGDDVFLYLGSIVKAANGSFDESFELNQLSPGTAANPTYRTVTIGGQQVPLPARKTGDLLLAFDSTGGVVTIGACTWKSDQPDPAPGDPFPAGYFDSGQWLLLDGTPLAATNTKHCTQLDPPATPAAQGAVNASAIAAAANPIANLDVAAGNFGELSVDVTSALAAQQPANPCVEFRSAWVRTRSSDQVTSNPEDVVLPQPLAVQCPTHDAVPPTTTVTLSPAAPSGSNGWYRSPVGVAVSATDDAGGTGVAATRCALDPASAPTSYDDLLAGCAYSGAGQTVSADGAHTVYAASVDVAGNRESPVAATFKIDATPPSVRFTDCPSSPLAPSSRVRAHWIATDATSGLAGGSSGSIALPTARPGRYSVVAPTATDKAGNTTSGVRCDYQVKPPHHDRHDEHGAPGEDGRGRPR